LLYSAVIDNEGLKTLRKFIFCLTLYFNRDYAFFWVEFRLSMLKIRIGSAFIEGIFTAVRQEGKIVLPVGTYHI